MLKRLRRRLGIFEPRRRSFEEAVDGIEIPPAIYQRLQSLYRNEPQPGADGRAHPINPITRIKPPQGVLLYELHRRVQPDLSVEVGMAYGFSTLYFLAAMSVTGRGRHLAIDPFQKRSWAGIGITHVEELGFADRCALIEEYSFRALSDLWREGARAQFMYIDGDHKFDSILLDFTLSAWLCDVGGLIVLDDTWMPSTKRVVAFIEANRADFERESSPVKNVAIFRKVAEKDERSWDHFVDFR